MSTVRLLAFQSEHAHDYDEGSNNSERVEDAEGKFARERVDARWVVAGRARNKADAFVLLEALGLLTEPEAREEEKPAPDLRTSGYGRGRGGRLRAERRTALGSSALLRPVSRR